MVVLLVVDYLNVRIALVYGMHASLTDTNLLNRNKIQPKNMKVDGTYKLIPSFKL